MNCPKCGNNITQNEHFCRTCGTSILWNQTNSTPVQNQQPIKQPDYQQIRYSEYANQYPSEKEMQINSEEKQYSSKYKGTNTITLIMIVTISILMIISIGFPLFLNRESNDDIYNDVMALTGRFKLESDDDVTLYLHSYGNYKMYINEEKYWDNYYEGKYISYNSEGAINWLEKLDQNNLSEFNKERAIETQNKLLYGNNKKYYYILILEVDKLVTNGTESGDNSILIYSCIYKDPRLECTDLGGFQEVNYIKVGSATESHESNKETIQNIKDLNYTVPSGFKAWGSNDENFHSYSYQNGTTKCELNVTAITEPYNRKQEDYLKSITNKPEYNIVSDITTKTINEQNWSHIQVTSSFGMNTYYLVIINNNILYRLDYLIIENKNEACSTSYGSIINSLEF